MKTKRPLLCPFHPCNVTLFKQIENSKWCRRVTSLSFSWDGWEHLHGSSWRQQGCYFEIRCSHVILRKDSFTLTYAWVSTSGPGSKVCQHQPRCSWGAVQQHNRSSCASHPVQRLQAAPDTKINQWAFMLQKKLRYQIFLILFRSEMMQL